MKTKIPSEWMELELQHKHGGDGFGIVEILDDDYVRIAWPGGAKASHGRAWLAWTKLLSPMMRRQNYKDPESPMVIQPFGDPEMEWLEAIRLDIQEGRKQVVGTHIVPA